MSDLDLDPAALANGRLLVVAPHPDDESLGCGGLVASLADTPAALHFLFVTDGAASHPRSRRWPPRQLAALREEEAKAALDCLGVTGRPRDFLRLPDAGMPAPDSAEGRAAAGRVRALVAALRPSHVLLPWRRDPHRDHRDSFALVTAALGAEGLSPRLLEYTIWLEEHGAPEDHPRPGEARRVHCRLSVAAVTRKRAAVLAHRSQTSDLIADDPQGVRLPGTLIDRLTGPVESYWQAGP